MSKAKLHLVYGGELISPDTKEFKNPGDIDNVGIYPSYQEAYDAWKQASQRTVDDAHTRYFIAHLHRLIDESIADEAEQEPS